MSALKFLEDLQTRVAPYGLTPEALQWVLKALHPTSPIGYASIPDDSYCKTARSELRTQTIVSAPGTVSWDLFVWRFPSDTSVIYWGTQTASTGNFNGTGGANGQLSIQALEAVTSPTVNLYDSTGTLAVGSDGTRPVNWYVPTSGYNAFRNSYASLTCYLTASATTDQGTCFASQTAPELIQGLQLASNNGNSLISGAAVPVTLDFYNGVPYNEADMALMNPRFYTAPARDGVYMPIRLTGPVQHFGHPTYNSLLKGQVLTNPVLPFYQMVATTSLTAAIVPTLHQPTLRSLLGMLPTSGTLTPPITGTTVAAYYMMTDNTNVGMVIFRGLDPKATVTLKYVAGVEYCVDASSPMQNFTTIPPRYDPKAIETYYRIVQETPDAYPASWNSLGTLMGLVTSGLSKVFPYIRPTIQAGAKFVGELTAPTTMGQQQRVVTPTPKVALVRQKKKKAIKEIVTIRVPKQRKRKTQRIMR